MAGVIRRRWWALATMSVAGLAALGVAVASVAAAPGAVGHDPLGHDAFGHGAAATRPARLIGPAWVVSIGDSYIAGEAGRWADNTHESSAGDIDALGAGGYSGGSCRRSTSAEIHLGGAIQSMNLACSAARTTTTPYSGGDFTPGLDFYSDGAGHDGQALALQRFATAHRVTMVAVSIGGNDFGFGPVAQTCVQDFLLSTPVWKNYCHDDSTVRSRFTSTAETARRDEIRSALINVGTAMRRAGYPDSDYSIVAQDYPSPLPAAADERYGEFGAVRQWRGGCGIWNGDLNWASTTAVPTINRTVAEAASSSGLGNLTLLDVSGLFDGRRLCERGVGKLYEQHLSNWRAPGAVDQSEWVENIRTVSASHSPFTIAESLHPNYWGQLALRNCLRQAYNGGAVRGGTCVRAENGLNGSGEPNTRLTTA